MKKIVGCSHDTFTYNHVMEFSVPVTEAIKSKSSNTFFFLIIAYSSFKLE